MGVYDGKQLIHAGSPANYVPDLMKLWRMPHVKKTGTFCFILINLPE